MPKTVLGKWAIVFAVLMPLLFVAGGSIANVFYKSVAAGNTILEDIAKRPALAITMLTAMLSGVLAFSTGIWAIIKQKERAVIVYIATLVGGFLIFFLLGEILSPH